jgi:hypothetical protein
MSEVRLSPISRISLLGGFPIRAEEEILEKLLAS